jgi:TatA/E family protein of Tat protein translocase
MGIENPVHLLFIAVVALVVLGPKRLPELARAVGKGVREFREAIGQETHDAEPAAEPVPPAGQALLTAPEPVTAHLPSGQEPGAPEPSRQEPSGQEPSGQEPSGQEPSGQPAPPRREVDPAQTVRSGDAPDRGPL